jgi:hypothetical protein
MQTWKLVLACIALSAVSIFALAHNNSHSVAGGTVAVAARNAQSPQSTPPVIKIPEKSDSEYGWGPFRTTDW